MTHLYMCCRTYILLLQLLFCLNFGPGQAHQHPSADSSEVVVVDRCKLLLCHICGEVVHTDHEIATAFAAAASATTHTQLLFVREVIDQE